MKSAVGPTFAEAVLSAHSGKEARAGDIVVCEPDLVLGTDGSVPMAIEYWAQMGGGAPPHPDRILFARDHYAPPTSASTRGFHAGMQSFADSWGIEILPVGGGISFLHALEHGRVRAGDLVVGGDSHTVTCGVAGAFATGIGSSDLACLFKTGTLWLRVPTTTHIVLEGELPSGVGAKDVALALVRMCSGLAGAPTLVGAFTALEFRGPAAEAMPFEERMVLANMAAEMGAMAGVFPPHEEASVTGSPQRTLDVSTLEPLIALPPDPGGGVGVKEAVGRPVDWVFLGTCAGGRVHDFHEALRVLEAGGGLATGVTLVVTPPTARVRQALEDDLTLRSFRSLGAIITETGCGPCCGTSGPTPPAGARVISTANRNFTARMGEPSVEIMLASAATCAAAATAGKIVDPRDLQ